MALIEKKAFLEKEKMHVTSISYYTVFCRAHVAQSVALKTLEKEVAGSNSCSANILSED